MDGMFMSSDQGPKAFKAKTWHERSIAWGKKIGEFPGLGNFSNLMKL